MQPMTASPLAARYEPGLSLVQQHQIGSHLAGGQYRATLSGTDSVDPPPESAACTAHNGGEITGIGSDSVFAFALSSIKFRKSYFGSMLDKYN
jgi:hypothetical protein